MPVTSDRLRSSLDRLQDSQAQAAPAPSEGFTTAKPPEPAETPAPKGKGGRPKDPDKLHFHTIGLRADEWKYLALWGPKGSTNGAPDNPTSQLGNLLAYTRSMAAKGPGKFGHDIDPEKLKAEKTTPAIKRYADAHGLTKAQVTNMAWKAFQAAEKGK